MIEARTMPALYRAVLSHLIERGERASPRGMPTREVRGAVVRLLDPRANVASNPPRRLNLAFAAADFLWHACGRSDVASIAPFNSALARFSDDGRWFDGAYGPMIVSQLPYVLRTLAADPDTRQAVVSIWRPRPGPSCDVPCTTTLQLMIRAGRVEMVTTMRSNDAWLGLPYDLFNFTSLQRAVAATMGLGVGPYTHVAGSLHLYDRDLGAAVTVAEDRSAVRAIPPPYDLLTDLPDPPGLPVPPEAEGAFLAIGSVLRAGAEAGVDRAAAERLNATINAAPDGWRLYLRAAETRLHATRGRIA